MIVVDFTVMEPDKNGAGSDSLGLLDDVLGPYRMLSEGHGIHRFLDVVKI